MTMWPRLRRDFRRVSEINQWSSVRTFFEVVFVDAGFQALIAHRTAHTLKTWGVPIAPALLRRWSISACAIDIVPNADIGGGCYIPHGVGIVIGGASVIGQDCTILQGVTLGEARFTSSDCPRVGNRVILGAGAKLLGRIEIGDESFIGANSVVLEDVPPRSVAVGAPATSRPFGDGDGPQGSLATSLPRQS